MQLNYMWLLYASLAALCFGVRGALYHWASKQGLERNLMLLGVFCTGALVCLTCALLFQQQWTYSVLTGILMGVFSYAANACIFKGFAVGKASIVAILTGLPPVVVIILGYLIWHETLTLMQFSAFALIVAGILLVRYSNDLRLGNLQGAQWGLLAMLFFGLNDISGKLSTKLDADLFPTLFVMFLTGSIFFCIGWLVDRSKGKSAQEQTQAEHSQAGKKGWTEKQTFICGMLVGTANALGMIFIVTAFATGITGLVSAVVAMSVVIILLYSRIFLKDQFKKVELAGMTAAMLGVVLLQLFEI
ncbi:DMT family transporter [Paenibacillus abyssi]|uniref:EamA domain-containing protein n=1 Tax=Paenibacillus abyssi TaxID=1340531 RepID=A0A917FVX9_9BACL|nr:DMT family transporter [Paenibacillus abyssi]GGG06468.1 hypothetical protein GCM10010916_24230 [Paenibacillus abyssi]